MSRVLIVGSGGQDGRLLHALCAARGDEIIAVGRGDLDLASPEAVRAVVSRRPDRVYYLAAHQHSSEDARSGGEWELFQKSSQVHVEGPVNFLEAIRTESPRTRFFYAASSLVFGSPDCSPQNERTPLRPGCVYGITKASGLEFCRYYRGKHGIHAAAGILFNHESELRPRKYLIPKVVHTAVEIAAGSRRKLSLGDLAARVDWGYAPDYVEAMDRILGLDQPDDFVVATGQTREVREVVETVFSALDLNWEEHVEVSPNILTRKRGVLCGDASKLRAATGWNPSLDFRAMILRLLEAAQRA